MSTDNVFSAAEMQMVTFTLGEESFGVDIMNVQEIIRMPAITRVPQAPAYVDGVTNLRGQILPVIDTRTKFSMEKGKMDESSRVIVVDIKGKTLGLNVDSVSEVLRVEGRSVEAAPASLSSGVDSSSIAGVVKINDGKKLVMILDVGNLCKIEDQSLNDNQNTMNNRTKSTEKDSKLVDEMQIVSFLVGGEEFGLEIEKVKEIIRFPEIVKVPNVPEYIKGIISLRDSLMPIIDLRTKLEAESDEITDSTRVVVVDVNGTLVGLTVDRVYEVIRLPKDTIFPPPQVINSDTGEKITGIARLDEGKRIIMLMDLQDIISTQVMEELSKHDSGPKEEPEEKELLSGEIDEEQMVVFRLASEQYGVKINQVQEITKLSKITKVPRAPQYVEGVVNLRGDVIPVINLRKRFELEAQEYNQFTRIIVSDINKKKIGVIVDEVLEVLRVAQNCIEGAPEIVQDNQMQNYLEGIANLDQRMIMMLDLEHVLQASEWQKLDQIANPDKKEPKKETKTAARLKKQGRG